MLKGFITWKERLESEERNGTKRILRRYSSNSFNFSLVSLSSVCHPSSTRKDISFLFVLSHFLLKKKEEREKVVISFLSLDRGGGVVFFLFFFLFHGEKLKKVFPDLDFQEIPYEHPIYHQTFDFEQLPKIHEHDGKTAQGFGLFFEGRLVCFYDYESDLSDGWENQEIHNNPPEIRQKALQMGANIIAYAFSY